jgi:hypothetical protein
LAKQQHRLLKRQIRKQLGALRDDPRLEQFLESVNQAYLDSDEDLKQVENMLELSSQELYKLNTELQSNIELKP